MDVYYIFHSGFSIDWDEDCLIFDYYKGKLSEKWSIPCGQAPNAYKSMSVFASHAHGDHFTPEIFAWTAQRSDIKYLLSSDIAGSGMRVPNEMIGNVSYISDGETVSINGFAVKAYGSTDAGVSFHLAKGGVSIFHAGDLNYWHWMDESTGEEIQEASEMFDAELEKIKRGVDRIDIAFFPVDPRMKTDYYRGAVMFCAAMRPKYLVPMHFGLHFSSPPGFMDEISKYTEVKLPDRGKRGSKMEMLL
jgi:L-ascorbate metabolism protein UlaG (beta-lactamase superfamily)